MVLAHIFPSSVFCRALREEAIFLEPYVNFYRINNVSRLKQEKSHACVYFCYVYSVISISVMFSGYPVVISISGYEYCCYISIPG